MATREQIETFIASGPAAGHHPPIDEIPPGVIKDYSPRPSRGDYDIGIAPKRVSDGTWRGVFTAFGSNWNPFAVDMLKTVVLDYDATNDTLVSEQSVPADDDWVLEEVVVTIMNNPVSGTDPRVVSRVFRDTLTWKHADGTVYTTLYDWPDD